MSHQCNEEDQPRAEDGNGGAHAEVSEAGTDGDELGDEGEEVADHEVDHGKPSPERAEAIEDEFGVASMGGGAETHGHFLNYAGHEEGQHDEGQEEADAEAGAGGGIRQHAGAIVLAEHDEDAGTDEEPEQPGAGPEAALDAGGTHPVAIMGAVDVFVGDDHAAGSDDRASQDVRRHFPARLRCCLRIIHARTFSGYSVAAGPGCFKTVNDISGSIQQKINYS